MCISHRQFGLHMQNHEKNIWTIRIWYAVNYGDLILLCLKLNNFFYSYFENMDRICHHNFIPNAKDVLRARVRTTGILETCFKINNFVIR